MSSSTFNCWSKNSEYFILWISNETSIWKSEESIWNVWWKLGREITFKNFQVGKDNHGKKVAIADDDDDIDDRRHVSDGVVKDRDNKSWKSLFLKRPRGEKNSHFFLSLVSGQNRKWRVSFLAMADDDEKVNIETYQIMNLWEVISWSLGFFVHASIRDPWAGNFEVVLVSSSKLLAKVTNLNLESGCFELLDWDDTKKGVLSFSVWEKTPEKSGFPGLGPDPVIGMG